MTGREKIEAALSVSGSREIGAVIPYEGIYIRDRWWGLTSLPWWCTSEPSIERQLRWREDVAKWLDVDWVRVNPHLSAADRESVRIEEREDGVFRVDARTGEERKLSPPSVGGWSDPRLIDAHKENDQPDTIEAIDARVGIAPDDDASAILSGGRDDLARAALAGPGAGLYPFSHINSPLWMAYDFWGFEGFMTRVATAPELIEHAASRSLTWAARSARIFAALGARGIWIEECMMDMLSPEDFRRLNVPFVRSLVDEIRALGMHSIYYFCGNPAGKWEHILSVGADALALEEGKKGFEIDIDGAASIVDGRCALFGNLDAVGILQDSTDSQLEAEIKRQVAAGRRNNGRFVMSLGSPITPDTPPERVKLYCDLAREIGGV